MTAPQSDSNRSLLALLAGEKRPSVTYTAQPSSRDATAYGAAALAGEVEKVRTAKQGTRNDTLNKAACKLGSLIAAGALDEQTVIDALGAADGGLDYRATAATIRSGLDAGMRQARAIADRPLRPDPFRSSTVPNGTVEHTSWWPVPIGEIIAGRVTSSPAPVFLARQDGHRLFYAAKINGLIGESESGKTWVALHTAQRALSEGEPVLFIDFEDTPETIIGRLRQLGATDQHLERFAYIRPDEPLQASTATADLDAALAQHRPTLVILDGVNEAMTLLGLEPLSNSDVTRFGQMLLKRISATGAGVVTIDHTGKTAGGKGALGAQAKRAIVDGCTLRVDAIQAFGRGQTGRLRLDVDKDRPGHVRGVSQRNHAGTVVLAAQDADDLIVVTIEPPTTGSGSADTFRPTAIMQRLSELLEGESEPQTSNRISEAIGGRRQVAVLALSTLVSEMFVAVANGPNRTKLHTSIRPYRQTTDPLSDQYIEAPAAA